MFGPKCRIVASNSSTPTRTHIRKRRKALLDLESLENRQLLSSTFTWSGGGDTTNWMEGANWVSGIAPTAGADLVFEASPSKTTSVNNFPAGTLFNSITINDAYHLSGNRISLGGNLGESVATSTYALDTTLTSNLDIEVATGAVLTMSGMIDDGAGTIGISVNQDTGSQGTLNLSAANVYHGTTTLTYGTLSIDNGGALGTGPFQLTPGMMFERYAPALRQHHRAQCDHAQRGADVTGWPGR